MKKLWQADNCKFENGTKVKVISGMKTGLSGTVFSSHPHYHIWGFFFGYHEPRYYIKLPNNKMIWSFERQLEVCDA